MDKTPRIGIGQFVKFDYFGKLMFGRVTSSQGPVLNIKSTLQTKHSQPQFHFRENEVIELTHTEVLKLHDL